MLSKPQPTSAVRPPLSPAANMVLSAVFFAIMGTLVKHLTKFPFYQLVLFRSVAILVICLPQILMSGEKIFGAPENRKLLALRGLFGTGGLTLYFLTIQRLDFGTSATIQYTSPIFTALIATYILRQPKVDGALAWMMLAFLGVGTIYKFDFGSDRLEIVLLGLLAAVFASCAYNCIALLRGRESPQVVMIFFPIVTIPLLIVPSLWTFVVPNVEELLLIVIMGICTYLAQLFLTRAYQGGAASQVAAYSNLNVILAVGVGYVMFDEELTVPKITGIALILTSVFAVQRLGRRQARA